MKSFEIVAQAQCVMFEAEWLTGANLVAGRWNRKGVFLVCDG